MTNRFFAIDFDKILLFISICFCCSIASAQQDRVYELDLKKESLHLGIGASLNILGGLMLHKAKKSQIDEIKVLNKNNLWLVDRGATNNNSQTAQDLSDILKYASFTLPLFSLINKKTRSDGAAIMIMAAEATLYTSALTSIIKASTHRYRPFNYNNNIETSVKLGDTSKRSFCSGHVSATATFSFFTAKVLSDTHPNMKHKWLLWTAAYTLPATVGYLRYEAGKHFPTDIITGYIIGASVGYLIPRMHLKKGFDLSYIGTGLQLNVALN